MGQALAGPLEILWRQLNWGDSHRQAFEAQQRHAMKVNFTFHAIRF
jgi:hypothetical protein